MTRRATVNDASQLRYCIAGMRRWFVGRDITFRDFCRDGVTMEWLRAQDDAMATKLAEFVEAEEAKQRGM